MCHNNYTIEEIVVCYSLLAGYFSNCIASLKLTCLFSSVSKHKSQSIQ